MVPSAYESGNPSGGREMRNKMAKKQKEAIEPSSEDYKGFMKDLKKQGVDTDNIKRQGE